MMQARAEVLRAEHGRVWLKLTDRAGGCGRCDEPGGCHSVQISHVFGPPQGEFVLPASIPLSPGDRVLISVPDGAPLNAALVSYGLGTLLLLVGAAAGSLLAPEGGGDLHAVAGGAAGLALAWTLNRVLTRSRNWRSHLRLELAPDASCMQSPQASR